MTKEFENVKMIAFDMYGTLVRNDQSSWESLTKEIVKEFSLPVDAVKFHELWSKHEKTFRQSRLDPKTLNINPPFKSYKEAWAIAWDKTFQDFGISGDANLFADRGIEKMSRGDSFEDAGFAIKQLLQKVRVGILSNADNNYLWGSIYKHQWEFELIISSELARTYKPDPKIFQLYCERVGLLPDEVLYVGDSLYDDVHGAKNAGLHAVQILRSQDTPGRTPVPQEVKLIPPDLVISSLEELLSIVL
ncbi:MAG: hypothetical protein CL889_00320 [Dehalococcoidia bacterium]|nr:hypothetical protein [Dehalococcoidia bacterium]|tara:strand:+ start:2461 stop:3201 length:741 start_codon:yes stop_codon:yes gene_type:complete